MNERSPRWLAVTVLAAVLGVAGCASKKAPEPSTPPPVPQATETPQTPPPAPAPAETAPAPAPGSSDFQPVFFDFDSYTLRDDGRSALDQNAKLLRDNPSLAITIEGHCDERGTAEYNQALGERRAQAARDYLAAAGIAASRMQVISYGKERPFDPGHDEAAWQKNRRAHFVVRS